ncbi:hypothetical protein NDU88_004324 [Pleurodeles waltl]|uniref:Uncharacterized protein n=1 Tax=Pleurodeles waltl TaxID=8319 RepID=A0AAV7KZL9_PLEWA|nr:hypothetical protein NDU88_004324 [Pleurodeles waltl]
MGNGSKAAAAAVGLVARQETMAHRSGDLKDSMEVMDGERGSAEPTNVTAPAARIQLACHKMHSAIQHVAKTCSEFAVRMGEAETRMSKLEDEAYARKEASDLMKAYVDNTQ